MRTSELLGAELDWAVARCEGATEEWRSGAPFLWDGVPCIRVDGHDVNYRPSTNWAEGGPIIEREHIGLWSEGYDWEAKIQTGAGAWLVEWDEESPLVAAMRCYVASKLGEEIEIPTELTQGEKK
jgi:hypothetical protein